MEEFRSHKKTGQNATGKLTITPKEEVKALIRRSPDYFDMILMRMVFEIKPANGLICLILYLKTRNLMSDLTTHSGYMNRFWELVSEITTIGLQ